MKILFFDLETTGTDFRFHAIHQMAIMIVKDGKVIEQLSYNMKPFDGALVDDQALAVSGVTKEQIYEYPDDQQVFLSFRALLNRYIDKFNKQDKFFLAGYNNSAFDNAFLRIWFERCGEKYFGSYFWSNSLDIMSLATQHLLKVRATMPDFKLKTVAITLNIQIDESKLHDAGYDVWLTYQIYCAVINDQHKGLWATDRIDLIPVEYQDTFFQL